MRFSGDVDPATWEERRRVARGWIEVARLAERLRRERAGEPLLELESGGAGESRCAERPGSRTSRPSALVLVREDRGDPGR